VDKKTTKRALIIAAIALPVAAGALWLVLGTSIRTGSKAPLPEAPATGFAFMDLGGQAVLSPSLRQYLDERLGDGAIERIGTIDLSFDHRSIFQDLLPDIAELDQALNSSPRERIEHPVVRLTYRYPEHRGTPFDLVQLIFARHDNRPLCFRVTFVREREGASQALIQKYGDPATDHPLDGGGSLKRWNAEGQAMVLLKSPDRIGRPVTHVMIYFTDAIKALLARAQSQDRGLTEGKDLF